ncbi:uncharacterized protein LOC134249216, partial [Saccostrea cucullata]|uniref:uncharacterized protein LOC134249216 n=1 Tax=Saccostrea cuccullata TaxID=36930 RepID=UPI002ED1D060
MNEIKEEVICLMGKIKQKRIGRRQVRNDSLLKMIRPEFHKSLVVTGITEYRHISLGLPNKIWVSDKNSLILTSANGDILHQLAVTNNGAGVHTVTREKELIYMNQNGNICKLSLDNTTESTLVKRSDPWKPHCIYSSLLNGDLVVGSGKYDIGKDYHIEAKVTRYNNKGSLPQTIQYKGDGQTLYNCPVYITEISRHGDVIVSDFRTSHSGALVVTDSEGGYRFSYIGPPTGGLQILPCGICTDVLSNILVCCGDTGSIQVIDKDGHFLLRLFRFPDIKMPWCLAYDNTNHLLW